jgi:hypothetical protein
VSCGSISLSAGPLVLFEFCPLVVCLFRRFPTTRCVQAVREDQVVAISEELLKALGQLTVTFGAFDAEVTWLAEVLDAREREVAREKLGRMPLGPKITHLGKEIERIASCNGIADDPLTSELLALIPELESITERRNHLVHGAITYEPVTATEYIYRRGEDLELTPDLVWELIQRIRNVLPRVFDLGLAFLQDWKRRAKNQQGRSSLENQPE